MAPKILSFGYRGSFPRVKLPVSKITHSPWSSDEVKKCRAVPPIFLCAFTTWAGTALPLPARQQRNRSTRTDRQIDASAAAFVLLLDFKSRASYVQQRIASHCSNSPCCLSVCVGFSTLLLLVSVMKLSLFHRGMPNDSAFRNTSNYLLINLKIYAAKCHNGPSQAVLKTHLEDLSLF